LFFVCQSFFVVLFRTGDIHEYLSPNVPGALNRWDPLSADTPYTRWMVSNHVGHHVVRGRGNFNIVFPGPDYLFGTGFVPDANADCDTN
jgi:hypothetical protein